MNKLNEEEKRYYDVIQFTNALCVSLTIEILNGTFPNVTFEDISVGDGTHWICVWGNYAAFIHPHTLSMFLSKAVEIYNYIQLIAYHFEEKKK